MAEEFSKSVEMGLKLSKRVYYGKEKPPKPPVMDRKLTDQVSLLPTAPMLYAVITEPGIVDNPDVPSYQPYVHGRCEPPALIPLHMQRVAMEVDCYLDTAFVTVNGTWRVHCVTAGKRCDCRIAIPMGEQGSVLGVEMESPLKSHYTQWITLDDTKDVDNAKDGFLLKRQIYTLKIPDVEGGFVLSMKVSWSQKLLYQDGKFCLSIPFSFPSHVMPVGRKLLKKESIILNVNCGMETEVLFQTSSHPLKELRRHAGNLGFSYEREVLTWSMNDFNFSYTVSLKEIFGSLLVQSPSLHDIDQREMFCFCLYPGNSCKVFRKEVVFVVDISASMQGGPLQSAKTAIMAALSKLDSADTFNIIAFNDNILLFSSSMELATKDTLEEATKWISLKFVAEGGTNILLPLTEATGMMSKGGDLLSLIFLITDGAVEDERDICNVMKGQCTKAGLYCPRIFTFGIGAYCNHYFLQMLAQIGRGYYDAAYDVDSINFRMERLFSNALSITLADMQVDALENPDELELYPSLLPDLSSASPLIISGRYKGHFPDSIKVTCISADLSHHVFDVKVQKAKDIPLDRVIVKRQIDTLTAQAWLSGSQQLIDKVSKVSLQTGVPSEYTNLILVETDKRKQAAKLEGAEETTAHLDGQKIIFLRSLGLGFGNLKATAQNLPLETAEPKLHETSEIILKAASTTCGRLLDCCCCMCFIQFCSRLNDRCAVTFTQLCTALACFECLNCFCDVCLSCDELCQ